MVVHHCSADKYAHRRTCERRKLFASCMFEWLRIVRRRGPVTLHYYAPHKTLGFWATSHEVTNIRALWSFTIVPRTNMPTGERVSGANCSRLACLNGCASFDGEGRSLFTITRHIRRSAFGPPHMR